MAAAIGVAFLVMGFFLTETPQAPPTRTQTITVIEPGVLVPAPDGTHRIVPLSELQGGTNAPAQGVTPR